MDEDTQQQVTDIESGIASVLWDYSFNIQGWVIGLLTARWLSRVPADRLDEVRTMHTTMVTELLEEVRRRVECTKKN